jgi:hypothetical protein
LLIVYFEAIARKKWSETLFFLPARGDPARSRFQTALHPDFRRIWFLLGLPDGNVLFFA